MGVGKTVARNTVFNFIAKSADLLINFLLGIALARGLGAEQYGVYAFMIWFLGLAVIIVNLGAGEMAKRFIAEYQGRGSGDGSGVIKLALSVRVGAALTIALLMGILFKYIAQLFGYEGEQFYFLLVALALLPQALNAILPSIYLGFQRVEYSAYLVLASNPLRAAVVLTLLFLDFGVQEILLANIAIWFWSAFLGAFFLQRLLPLQKIFKGSLDQAALRASLKYAFTLAAIFFVNFLVYKQGEVFLLGLYSQAEEIGFYTLATKLPAAVTEIVPIVFAAVLLPAISEQVGREDMAKVRQIYLTAARYLAILSLPLAAIGIALAKPIILVLYGAEYEPTALLMQITFIPCAFGALTFGIISLLYGVNRPGIAFKVGLVLAILNLGLGLWLIPEYGPLGAAIGSSIPRLLAFPIYAWFAYRLINTPWPFKHTARVAVASGVLGIALWGLQTQLSAVWALVVGFILILLLLPILLLAFRAVNVEDLEQIRQISSALPMNLGEYVVIIINFIQKLPIPGTKWSGGK